MRVCPPRNSKPRFGTYVVAAQNLKKFRKLLRSHFPVHEMDTFGAGCGHVSERMRLVSMHEINGPRILKRHVHADERGSLERLFAADELASAGIQLNAVHINLTRTTHSGTVKGLHMQLQPYAETKVVTCIAGRIFDVAIDLRPESMTFGKWFGIELSPDKPESLLIPKGFAHGMQCLEPNSMVHYVHSNAYAPSAETGVHPLDPDVAVTWPLPPRYLSLKDRSLPWLADFGEVMR